MRDYNGPIPTPPMPEPRRIAPPPKWVELNEESPCSECGEPMIALLITSLTLEGVERYQLAKKQCRNSCVTSAV